MKTWFAHKPVGNLEEWLKIATGDLCESAKARITLEIETHYKEAVESHLASDASLGRAQTLALQELGDPKAAKRRFRKSHLTEKEEAKLNDMYELARKRPSVVAIVIVTLSLILTLARHRDIQSVAFCALMFIFCVLLPLTSYAIARRMPLKSSALWLICLMRILICLLITMFLIVSWWAEDNFYVVPALRWLFRYPPILVGVLISVRIFYWLRIWNKVRRDKTGWSVNLSGSNPTSAS
jgi:hypothetical protein